MKQHQIILADLRQVCKHTCSKNTSPTRSFDPPSAPPAKAPSRRPEKFSANPAISSRLLNISLISFGARIGSTLSLIVTRSSEGVCRRLGRRGRFPKLWSGRELTGKSLCPRPRPMRMTWSATDSKSRNGRM